MRVKVGDDWFEASPDLPIAVELNKLDKLNISAMHPAATVYASFSDNDPKSQDEMRTWMLAGTDKE